MERAKLLITTVGGLGLIRNAPGTWGSIPAAVALFVLLALHVDRTTYTVVAVAILVVASVLCIALTPWSERWFDRKDPRPMVLDEVAGQALASLAAPAAAFTDPAMAALFIALSFGFFRLFDILKPGLIGAAQNLPSGWGVLMDDLLAGALALGFILIGWNLIA
jgi:phosphatidylglycerophosphatase A